MMKKLAYIAFGILIFTSCKKEEPNPVEPNLPVATGPNLILKFQFDSSQERLDNLGNPATIPAENAALSPTFNSISGHFVELVPDELTAYGAGEQLYKGQETTMGGANAILFDSARVVAAGEEFVKIPLSSVQAGTYKYMRVSVSYQNFEFPFRSVQLNQNFTGTLASFLGFNQYISTYTIRTDEDVVNANKLQGYWGFETHDESLPVTIPVQTGQAEGTTVVNPINSTSPVPIGSCVITGQFANNGFEITGNETEDITVVISLSTNQSLEWKEGGTPDGDFDPVTDTIVDMGLRGMIPIVQ